MTNETSLSVKNAFEGAQEVVKELQKAHADMKKNEADCPLNDDDVEQIYAYGYDLWKAQRLEEAKEVFELVVMYRASSHRYLNALARCYYDLGQYERCIGMYQMSSIAGGDPIHNLLQISFCQFRLGNLPQASFAAHMIVETHKMDASSVEPRFLEQARALQGLVDQAMSVSGGGQLPQVVDNRTPPKEGVVSSASVAANGRTPRKTSI